MFTRQNQKKTPPDFQTDTSEAPRFIDYLHSDKPWLLTALKPDTKLSESKLFQPGDKAAASWIQSLNDKGWNIYVQVSQLKAGYSADKKAAKTNVACTYWVWVDIDPAKDKPLAEERARILRLLTVDLPEGVPPPTLIIDSGGGFWGLWALDAPFTVDGDPARILEIEDRNRWLEKKFGADACHNVDRICRVPGTRNWPDERKRKKGRVVSQARLVECNPERRYAVDDFPRLSSANGTKKENAPPPYESEEVESLDVLDAYGVSAHIKRIILEGEDPKQPNKHPSRSEWVFLVICDLIRHAVPDPIILGILFNHEFLISEHVYANPRPADVYGRKLIADAHKKNPTGEEFDGFAKIQTPGNGKPSPRNMLAELNEKYAVIKNVGRDTLVWTRVWEEGRWATKFKTFTAFRNAYCNVLVQVATDTKGHPIYEQAGSWWLKHSKRRQYDNVIFAPGVEPREGQLNLWQGFAVDPKPGDWTLMRRHIEEVLASGNPQHAEYILRWAAWAVQHPGERAEAALVMRGGKGTGKGAFATFLKRLFGQHGLHLSSMDQIAGRFNGHLRDVCLLFADEAYQPGDLSAEGQIKRLITEPTLAIEGKGIDITESRNCLHVLMASNESWVVSASEDERRFQVFDISPCRQRDDDYFKALFSQMNGDGLSAMLHDLIEWPLNGWHPRNVFETDAMREQKAHGGDPWEDALRDVTGCTHDDEERVSTTHLLGGALHIKPGDQTRVHEMRLPAVMRKLGWKGPKKMLIGNRKTRGYWREWDIFQ